MSGEAVLLSAFVAAAVLSSACQPQQAPAANASPQRAEPSTKPAPAAASPTRSAPASTDEEDPFAELEADAGATPEPVAACFDLRGKNDCSSAGVVMMGCNALVNMLERDPGERLLQCLVESNGSDKLCNASILKTCGLSAIEATPPSPDAAGVCDELFRKCPASPELRDVYTPATCRAGISSLRRGRRADFVDCMRRRCDLKQCVSELF